MGILVGKELGDDKENNGLFLMMWTLKWSTVFVNSEPNRKKRGWANLHLQCARMGTAQSQRDGGRNLDSTANSMMFAVVWVIVS